MLELSLVRLVEIIGEAAARVGTESREKYPSIAWLQIVGMRNRIVHGYDAVDLNVLWDAIASIDVAVATGAKFVREIFTGVYASDFGLWNTNCGEVVRHQHAVHGQEVRLLFNIFPEASVYLSQRDPENIAKSTVFNTKPDGLCVSGLTAGVETDTQILKRIKCSVPQTPIFANTGVTVSNVVEQLTIADGVITGTTFKRDGYIWNEVDAERVTEFMQKVRSFRSSHHFK